VRRHATMRWPLLQRGALDAFILIYEGSVLLQFRIVDYQVLQETRRYLVLRIQRTADDGRNGLIGQEAALVLGLRYH